MTTNTNDPVIKKEWKTPVIDTLPADQTRQLPPPDNGGQEFDS